MRKYFPFLFLMLCLFSSCGNKTHKFQTYKISTEDTLQCVQLSSSCLDSLKHSNVDAALKMIHVIKNDTLYPLSVGQKNKLSSKFNLFPVLDYKLTSLSFDEFSGNTIKYRIEFAENAFTYLQFNLIRINGAWFLTITE